MKRNPQFFGKKSDGNEKTGQNISSSLKRAQQSGNLNLSNKGMDKFPEEVCVFNELRLIDNWWDAMPLLKIDCSNNELTQIPQQLSAQEVNLSAFHFHH
jgi:hypothetical protein